MKKNFIVLAGMLAVLGLSGCGKTESDNGVAPISFGTPEVEGRFDTTTVDEESGGTAPETEKPQKEGKEAEVPEIEVSQEEEREAVIPETEAPGTEQRESEIHEPLLSAITKIIITNGDTGEQTIIEDSTVIDSIQAMVQSVKELDGDTAEDYHDCIVGYLYAVNFYSQDELLESMVVRRGTIKINDMMYNVESSEELIQYLESISWQSYNE